MPDRNLPALQRELQTLRQRNAELEARLEQQAHSDDDLYRFLFDTMDEGFCVIEFFDGPHGPLSDYVHILANAAYARHAGIPNVVGQKLREMVPDEADDWVARYGEVLRTGQPLQFEQELVATGHVLSVTTFRIEPAEKRQVAVLFKDVTERRRAEDSLRQLNDQLEQRVGEALAERRLFAGLVERSVANVHVLDTNLRWLAINQQAQRDFQRLFGSTPQVGDSLVDLMRDHPDSLAKNLDLWRRALAGETYVQTAAFPEGTKTNYFELRFSPMHAPSGNVIGANLFAYNVTERVSEQQQLLKAEEALRQAQKMEAVGQLTGGIAHDFNNLLASILGAQELVRQRLEQSRPDEIPGLLDTASNSARSAAALVHRLLAFSRRQTLMPQATAVGALVQTMEELIRRSVGPAIQLSVHCADDLWPTFIDPPQLESALLNLCINARDALPAGGLIDIHCANQLLDEECAAQLDLPAGDYLCLSVRDNGRGMPLEVAERAIDPFFTTKPLGQGTGLGLSMAYGFVRQSGGQLLIHSTLGVGTLVELFLPRHFTAPLVCEQRIKTADQVRQQGSTILLVEDQTALRLVIGEVLEEFGHQVHSVENGAQALEAMAHGLLPDLLISDIGLPGGQNGRQVAEACRARHADLPVLFITGYDESAALSDGVLPPRTAVLLKPFELGDIADKVAELLAPG
ncbi:PAS domain-containing protein [Pseudomonas sp. zfem004]|uniref:PAS domain-containing protein n=1 Tax=Pseudomonas sp. zfem004 TaxID=3078199 RepID=UPI0029295A12|nr:PAS domain-containing protein [Pseudomonas sp. zfem004]MDU9405613.1 PAS domain-containing protein [Pseudomonas sp. zfem004]